MFGAGVAHDVLIRLIGAVCGAALGLVFVPPRTLRGFFYRLIASLISGVVFATFARDKIGFLPTDDGVISGACMAGFVAWPIMGKIRQIIINLPKD